MLTQFCRSWVCPVKGMENPPLNLGDEKPNPEGTSEQLETGADSKTCVIAEIGINHNGELDLAEALIDEAYNAGANYAKFQTYIASNVVTSSARLADYQATSTDTNQLELLRRFELSNDDFLHLKAYCERIGIGFLSTAHDFESADFIFGLGLDYVKIPSGDLTNLPFLEVVGQQRTPVILSTGMGDLEDIALAIDVLESAGLTRKNITVLQCTSSYPAPIEETNLLAMATIREKFSVEVGFSDHTTGYEAAVAAVALGATVIEKHLTMSKSLQGPDHPASSEPDEFASLILAIRRVELALGTSRKSPTSAELQMSEIVRKSIVASAPILAGEIFSRSNLTVKRPGTGISPMEWNRVIGAQAPRDFSADEMIELA